MATSKFAFVCSILTFGCSAARGDDPSNLQGGTGDDGGAPTNDAGGLDPTGPVGGDADCAEENKQIYVATLESLLYRFEPLSLKLIKVGAIACPASPGATPFSMAVDRKGVAWINYTDGGVFHVSTRDAACTPTSYVPGQGGFRTFGMAFVAEKGQPESLYVSDYDQKGIGRIDPSKLKLSFVGTYGAMGPAELTGTGAARMFALFSTSGTVGELERASAKVLGKKPVPGLAVGIAFAFAHWGGDFWLFTSVLPGSTTITQFDYDTGAATVKGKAPLTVVGAGVSTCAPTARPK